MKVVLITGAAQGIGLATAIHLAKQGYIVYATIRNSSNTEEIERAVQELPLQLFKVYVDVTDSSTIEKAVQTIIQEQGRIDVVVNNAFHAVVGTCETCTIEEQQQSMDVNYFGPVRVLQAVLPYMRMQRSGYVIQLSSIAGYEPFPHLEAYVASKFALEGLTESLASHLCAWNIHVSLIEPGGVKTKGPGSAPLGSRFLNDTSAYKHYMIEAKNKMIESYEHSMDPMEVVSIIEEILKSEKPHLRYPVGEFANMRAKARFTDPSGDSYVEFKKELLAKAYPYDLLGQ